jgi:uncharacterized protein YodC (DUF2158 family)
MSDEIKVGSLVKLKSGGPTMTVDKIGTHADVQKAWVSWFDDKNAPQSGVFPLTSLIAVAR